MAPSGNLPITLESMTLFRDIKNGQNGMNPTKNVSRFVLHNACINDFDPTAAVSRWDPNGNSESDSSKMDSPSDEKSGRDEGTLTFLISFIADLVFAVLTKMSILVHGTYRYLAAYIMGHSELSLDSVPAVQSDIAMFDRVRPMEPMESMKPIKSTMDTEPTELDSDTVGVTGSISEDSGSIPSAADIDRYYLDEHKVPNGGAAQEFERYLVWKEKVCFALCSGNVPGTGEMD